jgi:hypothetical protein
MQVQQLDRACTIIAEANIALQLLGAVWRLLGQLVVVEVLIFVVLRPKVLQRLHQLLATGAVSLSTAMRKLGLTSSALDNGGLRRFQRLACYAWRGSARLRPALAIQARMQTTANIQTTYQYLMGLGAGCSTLQRTRG